MEKMITLEEARSLLGVSEKTLRKKIKAAGAVIRKVKQGRNRLLYREDFYQYFRKELVITGNLSEGEGNEVPQTPQNSFVVQLLPDEILREMAADDRKQMEANFQIDLEKIPEEERLKILNAVNKANLELNSRRMQIKSWEESMSRQEKAYLEARSENQEVIKNLSTITTRLLESPAGGSKPFVRELKETLAMGAIFLLGISAVGALIFWIITP